MDIFQDISLVNSNGTILESENAELSNLTEAKHEYTISTSQATTQELDHTFEQHQTAVTLEPSVLGGNENAAVAE